MFSPPTLTHAECSYQRPGVSGRLGFAMRSALRNGLSIPRRLPDCLIRLISSVWFVKGIIPEKFVAVRRKFVYKTQFNRCCRSLAVLRRRDQAKAFTSYWFECLCSTKSLLFNLCLHVPHLRTARCAWRCRRPPPIWAPRS